MGAESLVFSDPAIKTFCFQLKTFHKAEVFLNILAATQGKSGNKRSQILPTQSNSACCKAGCMCDFLLRIELPGKISDHALAPH